MCKARRCESKHKPRCFVCEISISKFDSTTTCQRVCSRILLNDYCHFAKSSQMNLLPSAPLSKNSDKDLTTLYFFTSYFVCCLFLLSSSSSCSFFLLQC